MVHLALSIIIPHYNSVSTLTKLINTIPNLEDIQIIVVDDHSDENQKIELLKLKEQEASRNLMILNNSHNKKGAGACRNIGLEHAKGKWVLFADADDLFIDNFFSIISKYFESSSDVIFFKPTSIEVDTGNLSDRHLQFAEIIDMHFNSDRRADVFLRYRYVVPWSKLIKRSVIKKYDIKFDEVMAANDIMFSTKLGHYMDAFEVSDETIYCVTKNKGSLTTTIDEGLFNARLGVFISYYNFLKSKLNEQDFKLLNLTGIGYLISSLDYGFKKTSIVYRELRKYRIKLMKTELFNPLILMKKIKLLMENNRRNKKYYNKT